MIDIHIHTNYSDGADTLTEVLEKAEKLKLKYISITDHETCKAYEELKTLNTKDHYKGKIIPGIEMKCAIDGNLIEVLGYNINTEKMQNWLDNFYKDKTKPITQTKYLNYMYEKAKEMGLVLNPIEKVEFNPQKDWASVAIYSEIKKHPENKEKLPEDLWENFRIFSKKYCGNKSYPLHIDKSKDYPSVGEAVKAIKDSEGLVFLPHLFIYSWAENTYDLIEKLLKNYEIDGIECYHSEFTEDNIEYLLNLCKERKYLKSGGSDYHGANKPNIEMATGKGNLNIPDETIKEWI